MAASKGLGAVNREPKVGDVFEIRKLSGNTDPTRPQRRGQLLRVASIRAGVARLVPCFVSQWPAECMAGRSCKAPKERSAHAFRLRIASDYRLLPEAEVEERTATEKLAAEAKVRAGGVVKPVPAIHEDPLMRRCEVLCDLVEKLLEQLGVEK